MTCAQLLSAYAADLAFGDPQWMPHPVRLIGTVASAVEEQCRKVANSPRALLLTGLLTATVIPAVAAAATWFLLRRYLKPRKTLLIVPSFSEYPAALAPAQCDIKQFRLLPKNGFCLGTEEFLENLEEERLDLVLLANPNNPTGTVIPHAVLVQIARLCRRTRAQFVVDESFIDFTREPSLMPLAAREPYLIVVRSLTKFFALPGLRIGYLVAHRSAAQMLSRAIEPWSVNTLALGAAVESMKDSSYRKRTLELVTKEREFLFASLRKLGWLEPFRSQTNFVLARIKSQRLRGEVLRQKLENMHLLIRDSCGFKGLGQQYVRFAVRSRKENKCLMSALRVVGAHFRSLGKV